MPFTPHASASALLQQDAPATAKAYRVVLDAIVSRATPAGSLLTEGEVADALGMSRTPVREAFLRLAAEGLLTLYPKRGAIVDAGDERETHDLLQTRAMFEASAVAWLGERGAAPGLGDSLRAHVQRQGAATEPLEFARADRALHEAIVAAGGNAIALALFEQTGPRLLRHWHRLAESAETRRRLAGEHGRLIELAVAGDTDSYAALLRTHTEQERRGG